MSRFVSILAVALIFALSPPAFGGSLDNILASGMKGTKTPAMGAVVIRKGKVAEIAVHGVRRNDRADKVRIGDVWLIGSDAKPMTAALIARLVERGQLSWDAPLSKLLPEMAMRPEYRSATLEQLLSHRAGLPHDADEKIIEKFFADKRALPAQRLAYIKQALRDRPLSAPGKAFSYSNTGFIIAAAIAERVTKIPFEELMQREVFHPLGMASVGFGPTHDGQTMGHHAGKVATPHDSGPLMFAPAGLVYMSLSDWAKFCIDQLDGAKGHGKLLKPESYHLMQTAHPSTPAGLPWGIAPSIAGRKGPVLEHAGSDGNWYAFVALFPDTGEGLLVTANAGEDMGGDGAAKTVLKALLGGVSTPLH